MQSNVKDIARLTSERTGVPEQEYKDMLDVVFHTLYKKLRRPNSLIVKLKGVGSWYLRRKRMVEMVEKYPPKAPKDNGFKDLALFKYENRVEIYEIFKKRLVEYEEYINERNEIRKKRYVTQKLLTSKETGQ